MGKPAIDIDKLARQAMAETAGKKGAKKDTKLVLAGAEPEEPYKPLVADDLPLQPMFWNVIIEPRPPRDKFQGSDLVVSDTSKEAEKYQVTVGHLVAIGSLAFTGKTESGISLADEKVRLQEGDHVLYQKYTGQRIGFTNARTNNKMRHVQCLADSEILCKVTDPDAIRFWI